MILLAAQDVARVTEYGDSGTASLGPTVKLITEATRLSLFFVVEQKN